MTGKNGEEAHYKRAIYVLMGYESRLSYRRVSHFLTTPNPDENGMSDLEKVMAAIEK